MADNSLEVNTENLGLVFLLRVLPFLTAFVGKMVSDSFLRDGFSLGSHYIFVSHQHP